MKIVEWKFVVTIVELNYKCVNNNESFILSSKIIINDYLYALVLLTAKIDSMEKFWKLKIFFCKYWGKFNSRMKRN